MSSDQDNDNQETKAPMLDWGDINSLLLAEESPCVSIYVPTSPVTNYREENRILYKDQIKKVGQALDQRDMDKYVRSQIIDQLESVGSTEEFWTHQQYGLAVFVSPERFIVRRMMRSPDEALGIVADSFHLRPALRETSNWMRYQILCVSLQDVALYDANRDFVSEVDLHSDVPKDMGEALGKTETSANRKDFDRSGNDSTDLKQYFQAVDQAIRDHHNGRTNKPLILAMVSEHQGLFREVSGNPNLLEAGLEREPFEEIRQSRLGEGAWEIAEQATRTDIDALIERFNERHAHSEGETDLEQVAYSATIGQIETVLIDEDARIEGSVDGESGRVEYGTAGDAHTDDVLDAIAKYVVRFDGTVRFLPSDRMPSDSGVAAVLRFAMEPEQG
ncbi:hypothetical protein V5738_14110 [Salinisphaera sp. SPP-AMP-43]|uniref:baeRF3 domain-containing protein n=1 Tax=Salinisphaera sp. SPP-AMP-43 TaxID=3121288 RepID=UPI003C6E737B